MVRPRLEVAGYNYQAALRRLVGEGRLCILWPDVFSIGRMSELISELQLICPTCAPKYNRLNFNGRRQTDENC